MLTKATIANRCSPMVKSKINDNQQKHLVRNYFKICTIQFMIVDNVAVVEYYVLIQKKYNTIFI